MARTTRSSTAHPVPDNVQASPSPTKSLPASKKRKRTSLPDADDQPASKQHRTEDDASEDLGSQQQDHASTPNSPSSSSIELPSTGDVPIQPRHAQQILDILEVVDTQGLLDRVFPLPTEQEDASSASSSVGPSASSRSFSFRALLKNPEHYPLRVLRSAVHHLFPISSHPRSRPSATASEQLGFCNLALSLLNQASTHSVTVPLNLESLLDAISTDTSDGSSQSSLNRKFALLQKLPSGDWWTSKNTNFPSVAEEGKDITDLPTAYAELVAVFPTPSTTNVDHGKTLRDYIRKRGTPAEALLASQPRRVCTGRFLDYGPYASFAPTFDQNGMEVGKVALGEVIFQQERKRRLKALQDRMRANQAAAQARKEPSEKSGEVQPVTETDMAVDNAVEVSMPDGILSSEQIASVKSALQGLDLEAAVDELLTRNARALQRLEELQKRRWMAKSGAVQVGSEEWDTAQSIVDSLAVLASLRPRTTGSDPEHPPLVPTTSALRKLHRTLPVGDTGGWYGNLPPARASALRDDTTIRLKSGLPATAPVSNPTPVPVTAPAPAKLTVPNTPQQPVASNYSYSNYSAQYRTGYNTGAYTPSQTSSAQYYSHPAYQQQAQSNSHSHYPNAQYNTASSSQQYYSNGGWYNYQPPAPAPAAGTSSNRATPQPPPTPVTPSTTSTYTFYNTPQPPQQSQQRAVANTVLTAASKPVAPSPYPHPQAGAAASGWGANGTATSAAPTLPPHLRGTAGATGLGTPGPPYQTYYQNLQTSTMR
ncbi:hypothetical protein BXZ70DRAFT_1080164 [Cristinia sonorae]|uniref:Uncharacterized protein n=1 Tax=Cristinia sonorae TaxID=1940300 RepID=A0A8K0UFQ9_9AGAR|nr:hypothetical protein BXZ70DRAFT_1080164 [Cristinia sonorae]